MISEIWNLIASFQTVVEENMVSSFLLITLAYTSFQIYEYL
jgi:hypothetical protein